MKKHSGSWTALASGILLGAILSFPTARAAETFLQAFPSDQIFYIAGQQVNLEAYTIGGNNYVKLRDIGRVVDFDVAYDPTRNAVVIQPDSPYIGADLSTATPNICLPTDGSQFIPQAGDIIPCDDGYLLTITDVSRWDANAFADGPLSALPSPTCNWSLLDQPDLPEVDVRHYTVGGKEYVFIRDLYETRRMLYTLYNAIGDNEQTWQNGQPVLRKDGSQMIRIELSIPNGSDPQVFWPWYPERLTQVFDSCPPGTYQMEAWDVYKDGVFQRTEYNLNVQ